MLQNVTGFTFLGHTVDITVHSAALQTEWNSEYVRSLLYFILLCVIDRFLKLVGVNPQQTTTGMSSGVFVPTTVFSATHLYILHRESKKQDTKLLALTSPTIIRFSKFLY